MYFRKTFKPAEDCYVSELIPGKDVVKSFGIVHLCLEKGIKNNSNKKLTPFEKLLEEARRLGANAVINVRISPGFYSGFFSSLSMIVYGDAVLLMDKEEIHENR